MATQVRNKNVVEQLTERIPTQRGLSALSILAGLLVWQAIGTGVIAIPITFAPPTEVAVEWVETVTSGELPSALANSLQHMLAGYVIAASIAIPLGFLMARSQIIEWAVNPFIDAGYSTPAIAYIPLIIVWFGLHFEARVFMVFTMCFFEILINTHQGISSIAEDYVDVANSFDATWMQLQSKVLLPASLPHIFAGLRLGAGRAVRAMIVAELFLAIVNLGSLLEAAGRTYETDKMIAVIVSITVVGVLFQQLVVYIEHKAIPWHFAGGEGH
jgi:ABC-type nitrate/sulfonate/bicarbonate transport system permease component